MAADQAKCDDCKKENCPQRIVGAVCSINAELIPLISSVNSRDPVLVSRFIVSIVGAEYERYKKAVAIEEIGKVTERVVTRKDGQQYTVTETNPIDNNVSTLALNIIKAGKMLNEIMNPPKHAPFFQKNIQNNFGVRAADEIRSLTGKEKEKAISFIDGKLDAKRSS